MTTRVHLADDHTMFRQGLESILSHKEGLEVVGSTPTGPEAEARVARSRPDVLVTQLDMQPKTAEDIISGLRKASPDSKIVCSRCGTTCATCRPSPRWTWTP
jgi:DNA-binding NarL/FixJ family response regulator